MAVSIFEYRVFTWTKIISLERAFEKAYCDIFLLWESTKLLKLTVTDIAQFSFKVLKNIKTSIVLFYDAVHID